jgi:antitoxin (DNA-binding transcriptional repressor) of toxin-antitoxin stability system
MNNIIGFKDFRLHAQKYIDAVKKGRSFVVVRRSKPIFKISAPETEDTWEEVVDFTSIKKDGAALDDVLTHL